MSKYQEGDFVWSCYEGEWYEAEIEEIEEGGTYRVFYHEYDDSVPGQPLHLIKDYEEGETEPPPDGPNQGVGVDEEEEEEEEPQVDEEDDEEEEEEEEEESSASSSRRSAEPSSMEERLETKRREAAVREKERKAAEAKAKADARAPTKPKDTKLYQSAAAAERRKSELRDKLDSQHSFQPKLATKGSDRRDSSSSTNRTNALYEHGKAKGQNRNSSSFSPYAEVSDPSELTYAPKIKTKGDNNGNGATRINRLYEQGKQREMKRLQKEEAEKEIQARSSSKESYDARLGFDKSNTGLGEDLVTTGARTNALYQEAQMRAKKKEDAKRREEESAGGATFKPRLLASKRSSSGYGQRSSNDKAHDRLYKSAAAKEKALMKKKEARDSSSEFSFAPDISKSQAACESFSLAGARHEALFMQGEVQRAKREEMSEYLVDGKEVDELTFTPAVNYKYNDELLGDDEQTFDERLYKSNFRGSKAHEEEHADDDEHWHPECTFEPERVASMPGYDEDRDISGEKRIEKLYKDSAAIKAKKQEELKRMEEAEKSRKLKLVSSKKSNQSDSGKPAHERLFGSWGKSLAAKEAEASKPSGMSFAPKMFTSKKSRESASQRQVEDLYKQGVKKQAERAQNNAADDHFYRSAEEEAAEATFKPTLYTKKKPAGGSSRKSTGGGGGGSSSNSKYSVDDEDEEDEGSVDLDGGMNPLSRSGGVSTDSVSSSISTSSKGRPKPRVSTGNRKLDAENAARSERTEALKTKAAELLAKRQAAKEAQAGLLGKKVLNEEFQADEGGGEDEEETF